MYVFDSIHTYCFISSIYFFVAGKTIGLRVKITLSEYFMRQHTVCCCIPRTSLSNDDERRNTTTQPSTSSSLLLTTLRLFVQACLFSKEYNVLSCFQPPQREVAGSIQVVFSPKRNDFSTSFHQMPPETTIVRQSVSKLHP